MAVAQVCGRRESVPASVGDVRQTRYLLRWVSPRGGKGGSSKTKGK